MLKIKLSDVFFKPFVINGADLIGQNIGIKVKAGFFFGDMYPQNIVLLNNLSCQRTNDCTQMYIIQKICLDNDYGPDFTGLCSHARIKISKINMKLLNFHETKSSSSFSISRKTAREVACTAWDSPASFFLNSLRLFNLL